MTTAEPGRSPSFRQSPGGALLSSCCGHLMQSLTADTTLVHCITCRQEAARWNEERGGWDLIESARTPSQEGQLDA